MLKPGIVAHDWRLRQEDSRLKTSFTMGYIVSSRSARAIQQNIVSKKVSKIFFFKK